MRFMNTSGETVTVAGLTIPGGREGSIDGQDFERWYNLSMANRILAIRLRKLPDAPVEPINPLLADYDNVSRAIDLCGRWTRDGLPRIDALESMLGRHVRAAERDAVLERMNKERA